MKEHRHSISKSFEFAFCGLKTIVTRERNFKIQIFLGILAIILGIILKLDSGEWLDLTIIITLVLILELVNTSIEEIVDLVSPQIRNGAKMAKDIAAGTVLVASVGSIIFGVLLFLPKIIALL